jgi:6-phosphogluconolactonase
VQIITHRDLDHISHSAARRIAGLIAASPDAGTGRFSFGLSGGSTPAGTYRLLAGSDVPWDRVDAWLSDERWVPHDHPDSNGKMAADLLLDATGARFYRPRWAPWLEAADSAAHYEATLRSIHPDGRADLILLGMGDDGHTASLFPGTAALEAEERRWYVANHVPKLDAERLTATYSFLRQAQRVFFLVSGEPKADALRQVLEPNEGEKTLPAAGVMGGRSDVTWLVDEAAASRLDRSETVLAD